MLNKYEVVFQLKNPEDFKEFPIVRNPIDATGAYDGMLRAKSQVLQDIDIWYDVESDPDLASRMKEALTEASWYAYEKV